ncbi:hypothetical protein PRZ48_013194 [Zasmidium cellare]|uniref:Heterokaryon incompatibility domain-containing protein n=1 Tax=Zasmidium cellare TaxID=395010 RepID=A0ABR0E3X6_ZASCE|nr:hypothetical protein PRZ48_013194 [Zasmidium cellare]
MKHFTALSGLAALAAAAPFYPKPSGYPPLPTGALPPPPPGSGFPHPTAPLYPIPTGAPVPPPGTGIFTIGPVGTGTAPSFPIGTGTAPPLPIGTGPAYPYKREAQLESFSFPSLSLPTGGLGGGSGIAAPTGLPSISFPAGGLGGGSAAPTGLSGFGSGSGDLPSLSIPSGVVAPTGGLGEQRGYQGKIAAGSDESDAGETEESGEGDEDLHTNMMTDSQYLISSHGGGVHGGGVLPSRHGGSFLAIRPLDGRQETYNYRPLNNDLQEIRLLRFLRETTSPAGGPILSFRVETTSLLDDPIRPYYAISYAWGDEAEWTAIALDGIPIKVPRSAEQALRGALLGHADAELNVDYPFWIDAICIQQHDLSEKAKQVAMMRYIYPSAEAVLVWLGADDDATVGAFETARLLADDCAGWTRQNEISAEKRDSAQPPSGVDWNAFDTLLRSRWFTRLWVLQEVLSAKNVRCFRDGYFLPWTVLSKAVGWTYRQGFDQFLGSFAADDVLHKKFRLLFIDQLFDMSDPSLDRDAFDELLFLNFGFHTSNAFDRIYALLGLRGYELAAATYPDERIVPDYERRLTDTYAQAMYLGILSSQRLRYLSLVPVGRSRSTDWPSWVPQFDDLTDWRSLVALSFIIQRYDACNGIPLSISRTDDGKALRVSGVPIGEIANVFSLTPVQKVACHPGDSKEMAYRKFAIAWFLKPQTGQLRASAKQKLLKFANTLHDHKDQKLQVCEEDLSLQDLASFILYVLAQCSELVSVDEAKLLLANVGADEGNGWNFLDWIARMVEVLNFSSIALLHDGRTAMQALRTILRGLRQTSLDPTLPIWIDAICIRQADLAEKSKQVGMMREIYANAETVLVWLGEDGENTTIAALKTIRRLAKQSRRWQKRVAGLTQEEELSMWEKKNRLFWSERGPCGSDWRAVASFVRSDWFSRLWIIQEISFAKNVECFRGKCYIPWDDLETAVKWAIRKDFIGLRTFPESDVKNEESKSENFYFVRELIGMKGDPSKLATLSYRLLLNAHFNTSNPWDRVYALLSLESDPTTDMVRFSDSAGAVLTVDYNRPLKDLYSQATFLAMNRPERLVLLNIASSANHPRDSTNADNGWPSWVPKYDQLKSVCEEEWLAPDLDYDAFDDWRPSLRRSANGDTLMAEGFSIGRIASMLSLSPLRNFKNFSFDNRLDVYRRIGLEWFPQPSTSSSRVDLLATQKKMESLCDGLYARRAAHFRLWRMD